MEPLHADGRHNRMLADTDAIRALGSASSSKAAELCAIAMTLSTVPGTATAALFGPVGASFLAALATSVADQSRAVASLSDSVAAAATTAGASAAAYDDADSRAGDLLVGWSSTVLALASSGNGLSAGMRLTTLASAARAG